MVVPGSATPLGCGAPGTGPRCHPLKDGPMHVSDCDCEDEWLAGYGTGSRMFVIWCTGTLLTIYLIDSYVLSQFRAQPSFSSGKSVATAAAAAAAVDLFCCMSCSTGPASQCRSHKS